MPSDRAQPGQQPDADPGPLDDRRHDWRDHWRGSWRAWRPFVVKPLRRGIFIFVLLLVIEYLVVPELVGASKDLNLLSRVNPAWLAAGVVLEGASLALGITRGARRASRILRAIGDRIPGLTADRLERAVLDTAASLSALGRDRRVLVWSLTWASLNWLLDAASLWCFVAAFGRLLNPVELFAAYGIANVAGVLPVTPAGLGVIDSLAPLLLVGFGLTRSVATLGVLGWRLVNFWLPIPAGAAAYVSLKVPRGAGPKAMRSAVASLLSRPGSAQEDR
jgi:uncharacterized membrane protein YbhN (UPF0104 family)